MEQLVFVVGASGKVGRTLVEQISHLDLSTAELGERGHRNPTRIVGLAGRMWKDPEEDIEDVQPRALFVREGISTDQLRKASVSKEQMSRLLGGGKIYDGMEELLKRVRDNGLDDQVIFVDVTAAEETALSFHRAVLQTTGNSLVTANKNPVALYSVKDFRELAGSRRYDFNTTVMAGKGAIRHALESYDVRSPIVRIEGMLSGTLGFVLNKMQPHALNGRANPQPLTFSQAVKEAYDVGYTEPNPYHDLNGLDVARKLIILARCAGIKVTKEDVDIEGLVDDTFAGLTVEEFFTRLPGEDAEMQEKTAGAKKRGCVLRYTAVMKVADGKPEFSVGLREYGPDSKFYALGGKKGVDNLALFTRVIPGRNEHDGETHVHPIEGAGAGLRCTAEALRRSIASLLPTSLSRS